MSNANFYVECDASHVAFDINCQSNRSFALNSNAQSVFDIVRPFEILGVECDVKGQMHHHNDLGSKCAYMCHLSNKTTRNSVLLSTPQIWLMKVSKKLA